MVIPDGYVVLARLGAAHGLRGDVKLELRTDDPSRLAPGTRVVTDDERVGELVVARRRSTGSADLIAFEQVTDRTGAEAMTGLLLIGPRVAEKDAWYPQDLVGLRALGLDDRELGEVVAVHEAPAHHLLVVREPSGARTSVPFVTAIVPVVDLAGGFVRLDPPGGLLADESGESDGTEESAGSDEAERDG